MDSRPTPADASPWLPFENRRRARDEKRDAVLRVAVQLFLEQGYHRATLNDVAERLNITKPALYNYFRSKDEILYACWSLGRELVDDAIAAIDAGGGPGLARLRKLVHAYAELMATDFGASLVRFDPRDLTEAHRRIVRAAKKKIDRSFRDYIAAGIADGSVRRCDPKLSAFAIAGSLNWIGHWYQRDGASSPAEIADEFTLRLTEGIAATPDKPARGGPKTKTARKASAPGKQGRKPPRGGTG
ncbi:MAG: TetR/AcrR family transcriptional regulator [Xanthobacteraceae bacterium]|nr:TetR/AcrR family transcriptional regulator [Xanthobacteraceae bacterium]